MAETTTTKTASTAAKPKAKVASTTSLKTGVTNKASPINKKGIILGAALVGVLLLSMLIGN